MANWISYTLDVLATSSKEIDSIAARLKQPSAALINLVSFEPVADLGYMPESDKALRFRVAFQRFGGIIDSHLKDVSEEFPAAVFLLLHFDQQSSYSAQTVILGGEAICDVYDGNQRAQAIDWTLLDIFPHSRRNTNWVSRSAACGTSG